jgi:hypothetical protein
MMLGYVTTPPPPCHLVRRLSHSLRDVAPLKDETTSWPTFPPREPMTRDRVKSIHDKVNSLLSTLELDITLDGLLPHIYVYVSLGTNLAKDPKEASRSRGEGSHMVHGRRREDRREEGEALQPPATTRPALPPPPGRHCRWAHPGTAAPLTPALPAQPAEDATETRPALPPHLPRHCRPHRHCRPEHAGTAGPPSKSTSSQPSIYHPWSPILYCNAPFTPGRIWAYI